jgi:hypothetical protein
MLIGRSRCASQGPLVGRGGPAHLSAPLSLLLIGRLRCASQGPLVGRGCPAHLSAPLSLLPRSMA